MLVAKLKRKLKKEGLGVKNYFSVFYPLIHIVYLHVMYFFTLLPQQKVQ